MSYILKYCEEIEKGNIIVGEELKLMLDKLRQKKSSRILDCLYAKLMILENSDERDTVNSLLLSSDTEPLSLFMYSAYNKTDASALDAVRLALVQKSRLRAMDAFDAVYIKKDIEFMWNAMQKHRDYTESYRKAVSEILNMKL